MKIERIVWSTTNSHWPSWWWGTYFEMCLPLASCDSLHRWNCSEWPAKNDKNMSKIAFCSGCVMLPIYQRWMFKGCVVEVLLFHRCQNISGQCKLMDFKVERWSFWQSGRFEWQLIGRFIENYHMRYMKHTRQTHEILKFIIFSFSQRWGCVWFHHTSKIHGQVSHVWEWHTTMNNKRMWCTQCFGWFRFIEHMILFQWFSLSPFTHFSQCFDFLTEIQQFIEKLKSNINVNWMNLQS